MYIGREGPGRILNEMSTLEIVGKSSVVRAEHRARRPTDWWRGSVPDSRGQSRPTPGIDRGHRFLHARSPGPTSPVRGRDFRPRASSADDDSAATVVVQKGDIGGSPGLDSVKFFFSPSSRDRPRVSVSSRPVTGTDVPGTRSVPDSRGQCRRTPGIERGYRFFHAPSPGPTSPVRGRRRVADRGRDYRPSGNSADDDSAATVVVQKRDIGGSPGLDSSTPSAVVSADVPGDFFFSHAPDKRSRGRCPKPWTTTVAAYGESPGRNTVIVRLGRGRRPCDRLRGDRRRPSATWADPRATNQAENIGDSEGENIEDSENEYIEDSENEYIEDSENEYIEDSEEEYIEDSEEEYIEDSEEESIEDSENEYIEDSENEYIEDSEAEYIEDSEEE
ncbi:hypothetical protein FRX31_025518 [Thalictrum thalictroides]|uniref:Uncharacterized protein n=1 Tax=Thalictrum thalictroides TaxID=46969 RepID=A0A7J6VIG5_THATH|nr:hypothetical protein FRX31_025518 [Thalictrum thalictroides]